VFAVVETEGGATLRTLDSGPGCATVVAVEALGASKSDLKRRFGISDRLAGRIGALAARGLGVTSEVAERAGRDRDLEKLLLEPALLARAKDLDTDALRRLSPAAAPLVVVDGVMALEEELSADRALTFRGGSAFSPGEISRIKISLLTEVAPDRKILALRKAALAPIPVGEKGALLLHALGEADPEVRREAGTLLRAIGLDPSVAETLAMLSDPAPRARILAVQKVAALRVPEAVLQAALLAGLRHESDPDVLEALMDGLVPYADLFSAESLAALARALVKRVAVSLDRLAGPAQRLLAGLGKSRRPEVAEAIWREVDGVSDRPIRQFFETAMVSMELPPSLRRVLCRKIASELASGGAEDIAVRKLVEAAKQLGDEFLEALCSVYGSVGVESRGSFVAIVDSVATSDFVGARARDASARLLLEILRGAARPIRVLLMDSRLCADPRLGPEVKRDLCLEFLSGLHSLRAERLFDVTVATLGRMGPAISGELRERIRASRHEEECRAAALALGEIATQDPEVDGAIRFFRDQGGLAGGLGLQLVGRLCASPHASPALVEEVAKEYRDRAIEGREGIHLLSALGWLGSAPAISTRASADIALRLLALFDQEMPAPEVRETRTDEGVRLVVGAETLIYTEFLPEVIQGLGRIACAGKLPLGTLDRVIDRLTEKFRALVEYREVWAPGNSVELARTLAAIARRPETPAESRVGIGEALLENVRNLSTARLVSEVFADSLRAKRWSELGAEAGRRIFRMLEGRDYRDREDRRILVAALGRLALNRGFDSDRERAIEALLEEYRPDFVEGRSVLARLAACRWVSKDLRRRISSILKGA